MLTLYRFEHSERAGSLSGLFVENPLFMARFMSKPESERIAFFDEALGKHSEIKIVLSDRNITSVSNDQADVKTFQKLFPTGFAYNPLEYLLGRDE